MKRKDKIPVPQIALPVVMPQQVAAVGLGSTATEKEKAVGDFLLIQFFYLLRVREYAKKKRRGNTRTIQFRKLDIAFKKGNKILSMETCCGC